MKTILLATDFSYAASKVANYAAQLAKQMGAKLILLHASHPMLTYTPDMQGMVFNQNFENKFKERKLLTLAKRLVRLTEGKVQMETILKEGFAVDVIQQVTAQIKPNYLIMSTVGQLPQSSKLMGSVATEMLTKSSAPLMLIPTKTKFKPYENVFLAIDLNKKVDAIALQKVIDGLKSFKALINIFSVVENPNNPLIKEAGLKLREILKEYPHMLNIVEGDNFVHTFLAYIKKNKADLVVVLPQQHNFIERWFVQSNSEQVVLRSNIPIVAF